MVFLTQRHFRSFSLLLQSHSRNLRSAFQFLLTPSMRSYLRVSTCTRSGDAMPREDIIDRKSLFVLEACTSFRE